MSHGLLVAVLIGFAAAAPSTARASEIRAGAVQSGPVLAGDNVAWIEGGGRYVLSVRSAPVDGGDTRRIAWRPADPNLQQGRLAASSSTLAMELFYRDGPSDSKRAFFGGLSGGPFSALESGCVVGVEKLRTIDVSGRSVLHVSCDGRAATVQDLDRETEQRIPARPHGLRLAGRFAAWVEGFNGEDVVVYDLHADAISYRIPAAMLPAGTWDDLDLQEDGKIVVAYQAGPVRDGIFPDRVAWASPEEPRLHPVALPPRQSYRVKLTGDRIAFSRTPSTRGPIVRSEVGISDLAGHARLLGTGGDDDNQLDYPHLDFDGRRVAWLSYGCHRTVIHVREADALGTTHSSRRCPLALKVQPVIRHGSTRLFVDCFGFEDGDCVAERIAMRHGTRVIGTGETFRKVRLNHLGRRLFARHHHRLAVEITARLQDGVGRSEHRRGRAVLRAP